MSLQRKLVTACATVMTFAATSPLVGGSAFASVQARLPDPLNTVTKQPPDPTCSWSRLQVPTAQGLRWYAQESCPDDFLKSSAKRSK
jgi:hypothetical protein